MGAVLIDSKINDLDRSGTLEDVVHEGRPIDKPYLVNALNYLNFSNKFVIINFRHPEAGKTVSYRARPSRCRNGIFECHWTDPEKPAHLTSGYEFSEILVPIGLQLLLIKPHVEHLGEKHIRCGIPESCLEISARKVERVSCRSIQVRLSQKGTILVGRLIDFSAIAFRVAVDPESSSSLHAFPLDNPVDALLFDRQNILYSGKCRVIRQASGTGVKFLILEPVETTRKLFDGKEFRNTRLKLDPAPAIVFRHPLTGRKHFLQTIDVSGGGFCVEEDAGQAALLPGMRIPELELHFGNRLTATCKVQVIYRNSHGQAGSGDTVKCGLAVLDMTPDEHAKLLSMLYQALNDKSYFCGALDLDTLWRFFFETGFIYPDKYRLFQKNKERIKQTYKKLYIETSEIARHFVYQDKGRIYGHVAMLRFYNNAWLIHHHAASKTGHSRAGLVVLNQIGRFINDSHRLRSLHMQFVFCYYRPENRFPARVFGGSARNIGDRQGCSTDTFAYYHFHSSFGSHAELPAPWQLVKTDKQDLLQLERQYRHNSGGLMLKALNLEPEAEHLGSLISAYTQSGFMRGRYLVSLKRGNTLKAIFMLNIADVGLNLSDLTNSITAIIIDAKNLSKEILHNALATQMEVYAQDEIPVLLYPQSFAADAGLSTEKEYVLWILNMRYTDIYIRYMHRIMGRFHF